MAETLEKVSGVDLLMAVYKNVKMAADSTASMLSYAKEGRLRDDLVSELSAFEEYASRAAEKLYALGGTPKEENLFAKAGVQVGTFFHTLTDTSTDHLAELMVNGANMGVTDLYRQIHAARESGVDGELISLAEEVCRYEESVMDTMRSYLH